MTQATKQKKRRYIPSSFTIIIGLMLLFIVVSWIGHAATDDINAIGFFDIFSAVWRGFVGKAEVILFIFAVGGILGVMAKLQVIDAGIDAMVAKLGNKVWLLIPALMFAFGLGGTTYGMWEETIAFIPILMPVFKKAKYGSFTAIMIILLGAGTGVLASTVNPFSIGTAVDALNGDAKATPPIPPIIPGVNTGVMQGTRWISFFIFEIFAIAFVSWMALAYKKGVVKKYATQAEANKAATGNFVTKFFTKAQVVEGIREDIVKRRFQEKSRIKFTMKRKISLGLFAGAFLLMIVMYLPWSNILGAAGLETAQANWDKSMFWFASTSSAGYAKIGEWYFVSVAALFLIVAIVIFLINFKEFKDEHETTEENFISTYLSGVKDVISVCLLIAVAGGLGIILNATNIGSLIASNAAEGLNNWIAFGVVIFIVSILLSFLVPSTSGFSGAFIPIFAQIGITAFPEQGLEVAGLTIMAFIFASGIANFVTPTSAALMGYTQYAGIPYNVWLKQVWKYVLMLFVISFVLILIFAIVVQNGGSLF